MISDYELVIVTGMAKIHNHTARIGLAAVCPGAKRSTPRRPRVFPKLSNPGCAHAYFITDNVNTRNHMEGSNLNHNC